MKRRTLKVNVSRETVRLSPSQAKALDLLKGTDYSLRTVASLSEMSYDEICDLYAGRPANDPAVQLFGSELKKIDKNKTDKIKRLMRENKLIVMEEINEFLLANRKDGVRDEDTLVKVLNALAKASVGIEITNNIQNNIFAGMTPQELVHEYKRLTALATSAEA
jgi:hypothetical protein